LLFRELEIVDDVGIIGSSIERLLKLVGGTEIIFLPEQIKATAVELPGGKRILLGDNRGLLGDEISLLLGSSVGGVVSTTELRLAELLAHGITEGLRCITQRRNQGGRRCRGGRGIAGTGSAAFHPIVVSQTRGHAAFALEGNPLLIRLRCR
jgi:hypothetical protein